MDQTKSLRFGKEEKGKNSQGNSNNVQLKSILKTEQETIFDEDEKEKEEKREIERREKRRILLENYEKEAEKKRRIENSAPPAKSPMVKDIPKPAAQSALPRPAVPTSENKAKIDQDDEDSDDDMFADDDNPKEKAAPDASLAILDAAPVVRDATNPALTDNWDDAEGYYRIVLGEILNNQYHVYANLGKGVFSAVVKAKDTKNNDADVAIKIIRNNEVMYKAGLKEMEIVETLTKNDPDNQFYTIRLLGSFEHKSHLCLVFECLNLNLRQVLKKFGKNVGLNIKAVRSYAAQLFLALSLLEKSRVVHADIKPDNILVSENHAVLKLADFGSAFDIQEREITPYLVSRFYRAPEIILGLTYDYSIDVWSVACSLFELFTGRMLFPGRTNNHMLHLMMETKGKFPNWLLRKATMLEQHFTHNLEFLYQDVDKISGNSMIRTLVIKGPTTSIRDKLGLTGIAVGKGDPDLESFADFLDKCLHLIPEKRLTVKEALSHPFVVKTS